MTVTAIDDRRQHRRRESDGHRLRLTASDLIFRARQLIECHGHFRGDTFGSPAVGWTLDGAVYAAAGFYDGQTLRDPYRCGAHRRNRRDMPRPCEAGCEDPLWQQCMQAFGYLAEALATALDRPMNVVTVEGSARSWREVVEANERLNRAAALDAIERVHLALTARAAGFNPVATPQVQAPAGRRWIVTPTTARAVCDMFYLEGLAVGAIGERVGRCGSAVTRVLTGRWIPHVYVAVRRLADGDFELCRVPVQADRGIGSRRLLSELRHKGWRVAPATWQADIGHADAAALWARLGDAA